ncbi:Ribosome biogenesis regulatory protein [Dirofilaria immitis]|nr:Ribosome biogenesis regulatory protein [Dirofilaria immitis]
MGEQGFTLLSTEVNKILDPFVDAGNLLIIDNDDLVDEDSTSKPSEEELSAKVRDNAQFLFNKIWELERKRIGEAICAKLPTPLLRLPREKPLPSERQLTKWEQYAKQKGLRKRKKDRKVFDEQTQIMGILAFKEWKARYGYKSVKNNNADDWLIEIPDNKDPMIDYFEEREKAKRERVSKNEMQRLRNIARFKGPHISSANATPLGIAVDLKDRSRHELVNQINRARYSTASHGAFQPAIKNEKKLLKTGKHHKYEPNEVDTSGERKNNWKFWIDCRPKKYFKRNTFSSKSTKQSTTVSSTLKIFSSNGHVDKNQNKGPKRSKSTIHRQQHFQNKTALTLVTL